MKKEKNDVSEKDNNTQENNEVNSSEKDLEIKENNNEDSIKNEKISPEEEITKLNDMLLRSVAELDNYKKRTAKEIQQAQLYSTEKLSSELLVIMDSLEAAEKISGEPNLKVESLVEGNNLLLKTTQEIFDKLNIEEINPINESFDPDFHQALATKESESLENTVIEVMQKGYKLKSKLLRPALVIVSKKSQ